MKLTPIERATSLVTIATMDSQTKSFAIGFASGVAGCAAVYGICQIADYLSVTDGMVDDVYSLEKKHIDWLASKAKESCDGKVSKAVQILLDYAMADGDEATIFEKVRCNTCGGKKDKADHNANILLSQRNYLTSMAAKHNLKDGNSKALRVIVEYAMTDGDAADIFTDARCAKYAALITPPAALQK